MTAAILIGGLVAFSLTLLALWEDSHDLGIPRRSRTGAPAGCPVDIPG